MIRMTFAALLLAATTTMAVADNDANKVAQAGALSATQVTQKLQSQGYTVRKIKFDDGAYKVKATGPNQQKTKLEVNATTGAVISSKVDDDKDD